MTIIVMTVRLMRIMTVVILRNGSSWCVLGSSSTIVRSVKRRTNRAYIQKNRSLNFFFSSSYSSFSFCKTRTRISRVSSSLKSHFLCVSFVRSHSRSLTLSLSLFLCPMYRILYTFHCFLSFQSFPYISVSLSFSLSNSYLTRNKYFYFSLRVYVCVEIPRACKSMTKKDKWQRGVGNMATGREYQKLRENNDALEHVRPTTVSFYTFFIPLFFSFSSSSSSSFCYGRLCFFLRKRATGSRVE